VASTPSRLLVGFRVSDCTMSLAPFAIVTV